MLIPKGYVCINDLLMLFAEKLFNKDSFESEPIYCSYLSFARDYIYHEYEHCLAIDYPLPLKHTHKETIPPSYILEELRKLDLFVNDFFEEYKNIDVLIKKFLKSYTGLVSCESKSDKIDGYKIDITEYTQNNLHRYGHFIKKWDKLHNVKTNFRIRFKAHTVIQYFKRTLISNKFKIHLYNNEHGLVEAPSHIWNQPYLTKKFYSHLRDEDIDLYDIRYVINDEEKEYLQVYALIEEKIYNEFLNGKFFSDIKNGLFNEALQSIDNAENRKSITENSIRPFYDIFNEIKEELEKEGKDYTATKRKEFICNYYNKKQKRYNNKNFYNYWYKSYKSQYKYNRLVPPEEIYSNSKIIGTVNLFLKPIKDHDRIIYPFWEMITELIKKDALNKITDAPNVEEYILKNVNHYYKDIDFSGKYGKHYKRCLDRESLAEKNKKFTILLLLTIPTPIL